MAAENGENEDNDHQDLLSRIEILEEQLAYARSILRADLRNQYNWVRDDDFRIVLPGGYKFKVKPGQWSIAKFYRQSHTVRFFARGRCRLRFMKPDIVRGMTLAQLGGRQFVWNDYINQPSHAHWFAEEQDWRSFEPGEAIHRPSPPMFHQVMVELAEGESGFGIINGDKTP